MRNIMVTLMVSQGTPMISHGDEIGRTSTATTTLSGQRVVLDGLEPAHTNAELLDFTRKVTALRKHHPVFRRRRFFEGEPIRDGDQNRDIAWLTRNGHRDDPGDWGSGIQTLRCSSTARPFREPNSRGNASSNDSFLLCFNAHEPVEFITPDGSYAAGGTAIWTPPPGRRAMVVDQAGEKVTARARSVRVP